MILNFTVETDTNLNVRGIQAKLKGSWKRKRIAAKTIVSKIKKRQKGDTEQKPVELVKNSKPIASKPIGKVKKDASEQRPFISSLFTSNPVIDTKPKVEQQTAKAVPVFSDTTFEGLGVHNVLSNHLDTKMDVKVPTPIQRAAIPNLIQKIDKDVIINAQTGSGKTFAFLLPILHHLITKEFDRSIGTLALILAPTRELALQIKTVLDNILSYSSNLKHWIVPGIVIGGEKKKSEKSRLRKGVNILVSTPGRLLDHLKTTDSFNISNLRWLVLDEADNLLTLGFEETLNQILDIIDEKRTLAKRDGSRLSIQGLPVEKQTVLCSATIEEGVEKLAKQALVDPVFIKSKEEQETDNKIVVPQQLLQSYIICPAKLRLVALLGLLKQIGRKVLVFMATGDSVNWHFDAFARCGRSETDEQENSNENSDLIALRNGIESPMLNARLFKLHGNMSQQERLATVQGFSKKSNEQFVLFCTDVAARGLDLPSVTNVIQYDSPTDCRDYVHRIGRTARLGKDGQAHLFLLPSESEYIEYLQETNNCYLQQEELVPLLKNLSKNTSKEKEIQIAATDVHMKFERFIETDSHNKDLASKAFKSYVRAYATHPTQEKHIFHIKNLHLGHIAKSFCLRDNPLIVNNSKVDKEKKVGDSKSMRRIAQDMQRNAMTSEFAA